MDSFFFQLAMCPLKVKKNKNQNFKIFLTGVQTFCQNPITVLFKDFRSFVFLPRMYTPRLVHRIRVYRL